MFGNKLKDFDDPFFSGVSSHFPNTLAREENRDRRNREVERPRDPFFNIFGGMDKMMDDMRSRMHNMQSDPNGFSFSSSSVMTYSNDGKSKPKIYQASTSTRQAPGQVRETRRTVRDSEAGLEKMAIGQHLGERGRVYEKRRVRGGQIEEEKMYLHMDESDDPAFDKNWHERTRNFAVPQNDRAGLAGPRPARAAKQRQLTPEDNYNDRRTLYQRPRAPSKSYRHRS